MPKLTAKPTSAKKTKSMGRAKAHIHYHKDGSVWAKGQLRDGVMTGYWEWFRKNGIRMRSGHFDDGAQTGDWTTYDQRGKVKKVTKMKQRCAVSH